MFVKFLQVYTNWGAFWSSVCTTWKALEFDGMSLFFSFYFTVSLSGKLVLGWLDWLLCCSSFRKCGTLKLGEVTHWLLACLWRKLWLIELSIIDGQWDFNYSTFTLRFEVLGKKKLILQLIFMYKYVLFRIQL